MIKPKSDICCPILHFSSTYFHKTIQVDSKYVKHSLFFKFPCKILCSVKPSVKIYIKYNISRMLRVRNARHCLMVVAQNVLRAGYYIDCDEHSKRRYVLVKDARKIARQFQSGTVEIHYIWPCDFHKCLPLDTERITLTYFNLQTVNSRV